MSSKCDRNQTEKPLAIDLYCGLGGWAEGFLSEGYRVIGFDIERHDYGTGGYPGELVLRDVRSLTGADLVREYGIPAVIVGSSPCQEFSYRAMPWKRAKALPPPYLGIELFQAQFRIQREVSEAAGHYVPMVVENVRGAQKWVGRARANFGSYYLWGDVGMVGRKVVGIIEGRLQFGMGVSAIKGTKVPGFRFDGSGGSFQTPSVEAQKRNPDGTDHGSGSWFKIADSKQRGAKTPVGNCAPVLWKDREVARYAHPTPEEMEKQGIKVSGLSWSNHGSPDYKPKGFNVTAAQRYREQKESQKIEEAGIKQRTGGKHGWFGPYQHGQGSRNFSSKSDSRKAASALIAKIPFPLAQHIARCFKPEVL